MTQTYIKPDLLYAWHGQSQLIVDTRGECGEEHTLSGFYFREARHLRTLRLTLNGEAPWLSQAAVENPAVLRFDYVHPEMRSFGGGGSGQSGDDVQTDDHGIPYRALDVQVRYEVLHASLRVRLTVTNRSQRPVAVDVGWDLDADFADLQEAQSGERQQTAGVARQETRGVLQFRYEHPDLPYTTDAAASGDAGWHATGNGLGGRVALETQQEVHLELLVHPADFAETLTADMVSAREDAWHAWRASFTKIETPGNATAEATLSSNVADVASFALFDGERDEWLAPQAGMPVYPAMFGRDALTAGWQFAVTDCGQSLDASLTRLGRLQSDAVDDWRDAEPGRIPFQLRRGPLARLEVNPFGLYYADFASPLMFVVALAHLYSWTGDRATLARHWDTARRVLDWARDYGDRDGDGYLEYCTRSSQGPKNQGWKDSGNAIVREDGSPVPAPLGTCELQGYWYAAQQLFAVLCVVMGRLEEARAYWKSAADLKERFNRDWWLDGDDLFALALDPDKRPVRSPCSNIGHCLAAGIIAEEHLRPTVGRLFAPDLFSGWGVRTLSTEHTSYNPISYHLGSVWAVEQATIVFGLRRFGFDTRAVELSGALFDLATHYPDYRIPECIGGYARGERETPGVYPRSNTPQLWNASAFPLVVHSLLGLQPVAPLDTLVVDPVLPTWLPEVILRNVRVAGATATLRFWRGDNGNSHAEVLHQRGTLHLVKQPPLESLSSGIRDRLGAFIDGVWHR